MPWLEKDNHDDPSKNLLFIHVPRCGGTSLMKSHNVPEKATKNSSSYHKIGMHVFFHRYKLLEKTNFPLWSSGNYVCWTMVALNSYLRFFLFPSHPNIFPRWFKTIASFNIAFFFVLFLGLTFVFVAPTICRIKKVRRCYLVFVQYLLCGAMESLEYLTGTNIHGYLPHLTAHKMLNYGMVSIYMYNRFGGGESFKTFIRSWWHNMKYYRETGEMEDWYTPCHVIPQFEYTHFEGKQIVQSIVKQEELKFLKHREDADMAVKNDSSVSDLPVVVRDALLGMPHANKRKTSKPWYELYDQETLDLTYLMYQHDFEVFQYPVTIKQRPDLKPPAALTSLPTEATALSSNGTYKPPDPSMQLKVSPEVSVDTTTLSSSTTSPVTLTATTKEQQQQQTKQPTASPTKSDKNTPPSSLSVSERLESMQRDAARGSSGRTTDKADRRSLLAKSAKVPSNRSSMMLMTANFHESAPMLGANSVSGLFRQQSMKRQLSALPDEMFEDEFQNDEDRNDDSTKKNK